jgi:hypothetical protein
MIERWLKSYCAGLSAHITGRIKVLEDGSPEWVKMIPLGDPLWQSIATIRRVLASVEQRCQSCWLPLVSPSGDISKREICPSCWYYGRNGHRLATALRSNPQCIYCGTWGHTIKKCHRVEVSCGTCGLSCLSDKH